MITTFRSALACTMLLALSAPMLAQANFSGQWELVESVGPSDAAWSSPIGERGSITHTTETFTLAPDQPRSVSQGTPTYRLDGSESRFETLTAGGETWRHVAQARWVSAALVITTTTIQPGNSTGWEQMVTFSLNGDGGLELTMVGPNLWPAGTTTTRRLVYRRRTE